MRIIWRLVCQAFLVCSLLGGSAVSALTVDDLFSLSLEELAEVKVRIATGTAKPLLQAPAAATVITAQDIAASGAQDLDEVLESVPGLHVSRGGLFYSSRYFIRGIVSTLNPQTLVLINGVPMTDLVYGNRLVALDGAPLKLVERIEIIRGPGSAVYGADAFAGVINIITKRPEDMSGGQASLAYGSFNTGHATLLQGGQQGNLQALLSVDYLRTTGDEPLIGADAQTLNDARAGTMASLAPGPANLGKKVFDARLELGWMDFRLDTAWRQVSDLETAQGTNDALDPAGRRTISRGTVDLTWHDPDRFQAWELESRLSYGYGAFRTPTPAFVFPPGACLPACFPEGVISQPEFSEENASLNLSALYKGRDNHRWRLGAGYSWGDLFETRDHVNFQFTSAGVIPRPGGLTDVSDTPEALLPEAQRTAVFAFVQDEWAFAPDWELTAGLRHDHYSDFGSTTNPRAALVWQTTPRLTSKLLYGTAFRAPAFLELHATPTPGGLINPDLKPERLRSLELAFNYRPHPDWLLDLNMYELRIRDYIDFVAIGGQQTFSAQNVGRFHGRGAETEARYQWRPDVQLLANYSLQHTENEDDGSSMGLAPRDKVFGRIVWDASPRWQWSSQLSRIGRRERQAGDTRADLTGYTTLDMALRRRWTDGFELGLSGYNLADADVREPSRGPRPGQTQPAIPDDLPQPGRRLTLELSMRW